MTTYIAILPAPGSIARPTIRLVEDIYDLEIDEDANAVSFDSFVDLADWASDWGTNDSDGIAIVTQVERLAEDQYDAEVHRIANAVEGRVDGDAADLDSPILAEMVRDEAEKSAWVRDPNLAALIAGNALEELTQSAAHAVVWG